MNCQTNRNALLQMSTRLLSVHHFMLMTSHCILLRPIFSYSINNQCRVVMLPSRAVLA